MKKLSRKKARGADRSESGVPNKKFAIPVDTVRRKEDRPTPRREPGAWSPWRSGGKVL